ncbi:triosephosphate isomerase [Cladophialophora yegresii CBS 114405]|uniref:Triosephosphate isomerase n=1 Tax=Cladophialophora yegresii CBS 114405 TaxID=1182544 RepID=W9VZ89_9EURO|nr:triosephosphate isomerase [Cladophialophora yegresii CBS 114405]EXJ58025.1 triosephosphate isomerase [Cladophialophora yegresii CBS 114405]
MSSQTQTKYPSLPSKLILTSTKAYFSPSRTITYLHSLLDPANNILPLLEQHRSQIHFVFIPDFLTIYPCSQILGSRYPSPVSNPDDDATTAHADSEPLAWPITLGAQNAYPSPSYGAYTGEIVPPALKSLGVRVVELNHAERRRYLGENDDSAAEKARTVADLSMVPLVCIGEVEQPDLRGPLSASVGKAMAQLRPQILAVLGAVPEDAPVIFAYEPVWAIGAAEPAGVDYVGPVVQAIREVARSAVPLRGGERTGGVKVVYGGSAGPGLWSGKANGGNGLGRWVDGLFLGRFAHEIQGVRAVVEEVVESLGES